MTKEQKELHDYIDKLDNKMREDYKKSVPHEKCIIEKKEEKK